MPVRVFISSNLPPDLERELSSRGVELLSFSLIKTVPVDFNPLILRAFSPDYLVFSSKNGVKWFFNRVPVDWVECETVAVGSSTAGKLRELGFSPLVPSEFSGEGLVDLFKGKDLRGVRFLLVRPKVARRVFSDFLRERGAVVEEVVVYETVCDTSRKEELLSFFQKRVDFAAFTSPSNFKSFLSQVPTKVLNGVNLIPIGTTTKKAIEEAGFSCYTVPEEFSLRGIVEEVLKAIPGRKFTAETSDN